MLFKNLRVFRFYLSLILLTLFLGSCASNSSTTEGKNAKVEEVISTLDNVNESNY